jgi:hypothetical protein
MKKKSVLVVGNVTSDIHFRLPIGLGELSACRGKVEVKDGSVTLGEGRGFPGEGTIGR